MAAASTPNTSECTSLPHGQGNKSTATGCAPPKNKPSGSPTDTNAAPSRKVRCKFRSEIFVNTHTPSCHAPAPIIAAPGTVIASAARQSILARLPAIIEATGAKLGSDPNSGQGLRAGQQRSTDLGSDPNS